MCRAVGACPRLAHRSGYPADAATGSHLRPATLAALATVVLWASAFVAIREVGKSYAPGSVALGRLIVSVAILAAATLVARQPLPQRSDLIRIAVFGVLWLGVYSFALNAAERHVDAGTAAMFINTGPILITVLAGCFLGEGFPRWLIVGCFVAFSGCVLIGLGNTHARTHGALGVGLLILAASAYAAAAVIQKPVLARVSSLQVTTIGFAAALFACLPFTPTLAHDVARNGLASAGWIVYLGVAPTALGFATWGYALRRMNAGRLASFAYLIPVVATLLAWGLLDETPPRLALVGGALCVVGVAIARR